jgi:hypothetical protein
MALLLVLVGVESIFEKTSLLVGTAGFEPPGQDGSVNTDGSHALLFAADQPSAIAFDGTHIWIADAQDNAVFESDPTNLNTIGSTTVGTNPQAIAFDGTGHVWVANKGSSNVTQINPDGSVVGTSRPPRLRSGSRSTAPTCGSPTTARTT